jgi:hypothetical protein
MQKLFLLALFYSLPGLLVEAQITDHKPAKLSLQKQQTEPDTNRVTPQMQLASYFLYKRGELKNNRDSPFAFSSPVMIV